MLGKLKKAYLNFKIEVCIVLSIYRKNNTNFLCKFAFYKNFWYNKREKPYKIAIKA